MILLLSLVFLVISFVALAVLLWQRVAALRNGALLVSGSISAEMLERWQERVDNYYYGFGLFFRSIAHYTYYYSLVIIKTVVSAFRYTFVTIEKYCTKLIESAHHSL